MLPSVPHERLLIKLESYGISGNVLRWIRSFLTGRTQYVKVGQKKSSPCSLSSGIPQGSVLGPILFLIFINDLPDCLSSLCKIFADDTKVYNLSNKHDTLQDDLYALQDWSEKWHLFFNSVKCKCIYYGPKNPTRSYQFKSENGPIVLTKATEEKDLGVIFDPTLKFDIHINSIISKANSMLGIIKRNFLFIDKAIFLKLYKALVRPHLEYGQIIWYPHLKRQSVSLEKVQRRATKLVKSIANLPYLNRLKVLELPTLKYRRLRGDLIYTYNLLKHNPDNSLLKLSTTRNTRGHELKLFREVSKTDTRKFSFSQRVVPMWNSLNSNTVKAANINLFKKLLDENLKELHFIFDE